MLRQAALQFRRNKSLAAVSILSLALGIGATAAVFSVIYGVLLDPYPYRGAQRMVTFRVTDTAGYNGFTNYLLLSAHQFAELEHSPVLDGAIATDNWDMASTGVDLPEAVHTGKLSANAFEYFGVAPEIGREFSISDGLPGQEPRRVVVLSDHFWRSHYGGDPGALGKTLQLDHENYTVIGVAPPRFAWFHSDVYVPMRLMDDPDRVSMIDARLKPGVTPQAAAAALTPLIQEFAKETPAHFPHQPGLRVIPLNAATEERFRGTLLILLGAVVLLLAVGAANVSLLLLGRAVRRQPELAMRCAIGASRGRIAAQLLTEAVFLAMVGCAAGVALAYQGLPWIIRWLPENSFPNNESIHVNVPVLLFAVAVGTLSGVLSGLWPALRSSRPDLAQLIQAHSGRTAGTRWGRRFESMLIAAQVALTVVLLAGAGAAVRTFLRLYQSPLGYDPSHLLTVTLQFPDETHLQLEERQNFYAQVRRQVAAIPGVHSAAIYPFGFPPQSHFVRRLELFDQPAARDLNVTVNPVSSEFFTTLKIPLIQGGVWTERDTERAAHVAVVNRAFAQRYWPAGNPIGRKIRLPDFTAFTSWMLAHPGSNDWLLITGVVGDMPNEGLQKSPAPAVFLPYSLVLGDSFNLAIRTEGNPMTMARAIREAVRAVDSGQPVSAVRTAEDILADEGWATERFVADLFGVFAGLALALAAVGLYSVVSFAVIERYREFGIRLALGASKPSVVREAVSATARPALGGLAAGWLLCLPANRALSFWTHGAMYELPVMIAVSIVLLVVTALASLWPAWHAAGADPMAALRHD